MPLPDFLIFFTFSPHHILDFSSSDNIVQRLGHEAIIHQGLIKKIFLTEFIWPHYEIMRDLSSLTCIEHVPPAVEAWSLNHWTAREFPTRGFLPGLTPSTSLRGSARVRCSRCSPAFPELRLPFLPLGPQN